MPRITSTTTTHRSVARAILAMYYFRGNIQVRKFYFPSSKAMNPERLRQIKDIFQTALDLDEDQRSEFVTEACSGDTGLQQEVESLLKAESNSTQRNYLRTITTLPHHGMNIARKDSDDAIQSLRSLLQTLRQSGVVPLQFETRLVQCEAELQSSQSSARACSITLQRDSEALGSSVWPNELAISHGKT